MESSTQAGFVFDVESLYARFQTDQPPMIVPIVILDLVH